MNSSILDFRHINTTYNRKFNIASITFLPNVVSVPGGDELNIIIWIREVIIKDSGQLVRLSYKYA